MIEKKLDSFYFHSCITKSGKIAIWESGGGRTNTGEAVIIASQDGSKKKACFIRRHGHRSNGLHALFLLFAGDWIIRARKGDPEFQIQVFKCTDRCIEYDDNGDPIPAVYAVCVYQKQLGEWDQPIPGFLEAAVEAAWNKAHCYHCREMHYGLLE